MIFGVIKRLHVYYVWRGICEKIFVVRLNFSRLYIGLGNFIVSRQVFFVNTFPKYDITVQSYL